MVFASRDRSRSIRRWVPQNLSGRAAWCGGLIARGDRFCEGGVPARRNGFEQRVADHVLLEDEHHDC